MKASEHEGGGSKLLLNVGKYLPSDTVSYPMIIK